MDRVVIVTKPTRLEELVRQHLTEGTAQFVLESSAQSIDAYREEHRSYHGALAEVRRQIPNDLPVASVSRSDLPNFLFRDHDLVIVCGPDGLFVNAAKFLGSQPVLTINPDPRTVAGVLMLFPPEAVGRQIARVQAGTHRVDCLPFVKAALDDGRVVWGINDIFLGRRDHVSARYEIEFDGHRERQSSSGIIVATGTGSTGWIEAVAAMVAGLVPGGRSHRLSVRPDSSAAELVFVVREPFPSPTTATSLVTGRVVPGHPLVVYSQMPDGGAIFSDGIVEKSVEWNSGSRVVVTVGDRSVRRLVP
jgi:NAD kinase